MRLLTLLAALAAVAFAPAASAQLLLEESFDYPIGTSLVSTGNYASHSGTNGQLSTVDANLTFPDYPSVTGNAARITGAQSEDVNRSFGTQSSGFVYAAFLVRSDATSSSQYFFHLSTSPLNTSSFRARVFAQSASGGVQYGISSSGSSSDAYSSDVFAIGETALLVVRYDVSTGQAVLYTFDSTESYDTEPGTADATGPTGSAIAPGTFALRQTSGAHTIVVDGVRVGTSYADVVPADAPEFTFVQPTAGDVFQVGRYLKPIWESPDPAPATVEVTLLKGGEAQAVLYEGPNLEVPDFGMARYLIPNGTPAGDDYQVRVEDAADPAVATDSDLFTIEDPNAVFSFSEPGQDERYALGSTISLTWTSPAGAPTAAEGGTVTVALTSRDGTAVFDSETTANDGAYDFAVPETLAEDFYRLSIVSDQNAAYTGTSEKVLVQAAAFTRPGPGDAYAAGDVVEVTWEAPTVSAAATARLLLFAPGQPRREVAAATENDGAFSYTLPSDLAPGDQYFLVLRLDDGGAPVGPVRSARFEITNGAAVARLAPPHFGAPAAFGTRTADLVVTGLGLPDGSEVAAFAGADLVGAGVVRGGRAALALVGSALAVRPLVPGAYADDDFVAVPDGAPLALRAFADGVEAALPATAVRVDGAPAPALAYVDGAEVAVVAGAAEPTAGPTAGGYALGPAYPNPTRGRAAVRLTAPSAGPVTVAVFDAVGRRVAVLVDGPVAAGPHEVGWDASGWPSGAYVVRATTPGGPLTARLTVLR